MRAGHTCMHGTIIKVIHSFIVLLCGENDLKQFGNAKVFSEMLEDLKNLEKNGITVGGETVKGALYCLAGDNSGSHSTGGPLKILVVLCTFADTVKSL